MSPRALAGLAGDAGTALPWAAGRPLPNLRLITNQLKRSLGKPSGCPTYFSDNWARKILLKLTSPPIFNMKKIQAKSCQGVAPGPRPGTQRGCPSPGPGEREAPGSPRPWPEAPPSQSHPPRRQGPMLHTLMSLRVIIMVLRAAILNEMLAKAGLQATAPRCMHICVCNMRNTPVRCVRSVMGRSQSPCRISLKNARRHCVIEKLIQHKRNKCSSHLTRGAPRYPGGSPLVSQGNDLPLLGLSFSSTDGDSHTYSTGGAGPGEACQEGVLQTPGPGLEGGPRGAGCACQEPGTQASFPRSGRPRSVLPGHLLPQRPAHPASRRSGSFSAVLAGLATLPPSHPAGSCAPAAPSRRRPSPWRSPRHPASGQWQGDTK